MRKLNLFAALGLFVFGTVMMQAQASRTWVSGVGDDANPCSRTAPCKTFAGAISKTAAGGEIDALDPAGYGAVTITKAITIDGGGGQVASVLVSGTNGIVVQANSSTDVVILRNLRINGIGSGINGIRFLSGKALIVDNCDIFGFTTNAVDIALGATATTTVLNSRFENFGGDGVRATTTAGLANTTVSHLRCVNMGGSCVHAADHSRVSVTNSVLNSAGNGLLVDGASGDEIGICDTCDMSFDGSGIKAGSIGAKAYVSNSHLTGDSVAMNQAGGQVLSYGNNRVHDNVSDGTSIPAPPMK